jgi:hypothetical protein
MMSKRTYPIRLAGIMLILAIIIVWLTSCSSDNEASPTLQGRWYYQLDYSKPQGEDINITFTLQKTDTSYSVKDVSLGWADRLQVVQTLEQGQRIKVIALADAVPPKYLFYFWGCKIVGDEMIADSVEYRYKLERTKQYNQKIIRK